MSHSHIRNYRVRERDVFNDPLESCWSTFISSSPSPSLSLCLLDIRQEGREERAFSPSNTLHLCTRTLSPICPLVYQCTIGCLVILMIICVSHNCITRLHCSSHNAVEWEGGTHMHTNTPTDQHTHKDIYLHWTWDKWISIASLTVESYTGTANCLPVVCSQNKSA